MPTCRQCNGTFSNWVFIEGKKKNLGNRKFCLECSPYGRHNTSAAGVNRSKLCVRCGATDKVLFYAHKNNLCKKCDNSRSMEKQREMKRKIVAYLGGKCSCGYNKCLRSLHLHHSDSNKDVNFAHIKNWKWDRVLSEIGKCILVCSNCHGEIHEAMEQLSRT